MFWAAKDAHKHAHDESDDENDEEIEVNNKDDTKRNFESTSKMLIEM